MFCGNGSLMRVAPIGLFYFRDLDMALSNAALSSDATHPYPTCAECCVIYTRAIVSALHGATKEKLATEIANTQLRDPKLSHRLEGYKSLEEWHTRDESDIKSSGYVVSTLEASLWAFFSTSTFQEGALRVVNLGDDADTVGAVYGGIAGAFYGVEAIPEKWIEGLQKKEVVDEIASGLASLGGE
jgi:ADP-ribosyl-[dinitrogen reductase] hydrolase